MCLILTKNFHFISIMYFLLLMLPLIANACDCPPEDRTPQYLCQKDFCAQLIVGSTTQNGSVNVHIVRQFTGSPISSHLVNSRDCPLLLKKGHIVFLCGDLEDGRPTVSSCDFSKRNLNVSELMFFTSGFLKCLQPRKGSPPNKKPNFKPPPSSPISVDQPISSHYPNDDYFCLLIPFDSQALSHFLETNHSITSSGKYLLYCPQKFFCFPTDETIAFTSPQLKDVFIPTQRSDSYCPKHDFPIFMVPPWLIPSLDTLVTAHHVSDTRAEVTCDMVNHVRLADGSLIESNLVLKTIVTADGTQLQIPTNGGMRIVGTDGTESIVAEKWSSVTTFKDKTLVTISEDKRVDIKTSDETTLKFSFKGLSLTLPDKTAIFCSEYGMVVNTTDGNATFIPVDSSGLEIKSENSKIKITEGLSADIQTGSGTHIKITPSETTIGSRNGGSVSVNPEGMTTVIGPSGITLVFAEDNQLNLTTADGTQMFIKEEDSLLLVNENHCIVVFPNGNAMTVTNDEIISLESDGTLIVTDSQGSNAVQAYDNMGVPCMPDQCLG